MTDIPKMLRSEALIADEDWTGIYQISPNLAFAAAYRIEQLESEEEEWNRICNSYAARIDELEAALRDVIDNYFDSTRICEIARKALEGKDD